MTLYLVIVFAFLAMPVLGESTPPGCLIIVTRSTGSLVDVHATLTNTCAKAVTAYTIAATVIYRDGSSTFQQGAGEDFFPSLGVKGKGGPIAPGETRMSPKLMQLPTDRDVADLRLQASAVILDDASAFGNERSITRLFKNRQEQLEEWEFWKASLSRFKTQMLAEGQLQDLIELAGVNLRSQAIRRPDRPQLVLAEANLMKTRLKILDSAVRTGQMSREEAMQSFERTLSTLVSNGAQHSARRR